MLEPDPSRRATSLVGALDAMRGQEGPALASYPPSPAQASYPPMLASYPPPVRAPYPPSLAPPPGADAREDEIVKSLRRLLWVLWGLGWILVPLVLGQLHAQRAIPIVMFGGLAAIIVATWHKGALIRMALRRVAARRSDVQARVAMPAGAPRRRIDVGPAQVRVHTSDLQPEELVGQTELTTPPARRTGTRDGREPRARAPLVPAAIRSSRATRSTQSHPARPASWQPRARACRQVGAAPGTRWRQTRRSHRSTRAAVDSTTASEPVAGDEACTHRRVQDKEEKDAQKRRRMSCRISKFSARHPRAAGARHAPSSLNANRHRLAEPTSTPEADAGASMERASQVGGRRNVPWLNNPSSPASRGPRSRSS